MVAGVLRLNGWHQQHDVDGGCGRLETGLDLAKLPRSFNTGGNFMKVLLILSCVVCCVWAPLQAAAQTRPASQAAYPAAGDGAKRQLLELIAKGDRAALTQWVYSPNNDAELKAAWVDSLVAIGTVCSEVKAKFGDSELARVLRWVAPEELDQNITSVFYKKVVMVDGQPKLVLTPPADSKEQTAQIAYRKVETWSRTTFAQRIREGAYASASEAGRAYNDLRYPEWKKVTESLQKP
jgi:hypothetical protein